MNISYLQQAARNGDVFEWIIWFNAISSAVQTPFVVHSAALRSCPARTVHYVYSAFDGVTMLFLKVKW